MATLLQPLLNPIKFHKTTPETYAQYRSRHMADHFFYDTIKPWQQHRNYGQPWQKSDSIRLQFQSDYAPLHLSLTDIEERTYSIGNMTPKQQNADNAGMFIYEADVPLSPYPEGVYFMQVRVGAGVTFTLISEPLHIREEHKHSLLLSYRNERFFGDIIFETGFAPSIRVHGSLSYKTPSSKDSFFEDQTLNLKLLKSTPFDVWELVVGGTYGIPDWLAQKLNRVFGCSYLAIDGRQYTKADGSKWEPSGADNYPMRAWSIDLRETLNKDSVTVVEDAVSLSGSSMIVTVDAKGFGDSESASSIQIIDFNG